MPAQKSKEETIRHQVLDVKCLKILSGAKVFCSVCNKSFTCIKTNHVPDHFKGKNHSEALLLKKPRQSILVPSGSQFEDNNAEKRSTLLHLVKSFTSNYVMFDEADYNGEKYYAFLIGNLNAEGAHQPYLIELSREITRRDRLKSAPYLRLKNIQRTTIGNIWKNYFFQKKFFGKFFF